MSRTAPALDCYEIAFGAAYVIDEPSEVALEDYARALLRARAAEGIRAPDDPAAVRGVHACGIGAAPAPALLVDLEDFARSLVTQGGGGLGWS